RSDAMRPGGFRRTGLTVFTVGVALSAGLVSVPPASATITVSEQYSRPSSGVFSLQGHGWGHGHGLSQYGAQGAATLGKTADVITSTYYPNTARAVQANTSVRILLSSDARSTIREFKPASGETLKDLATGKAIAAPT